MSTSRKLRVKLAKHRRSARKAARTVTARSAVTGTQFVCFCHWLSGQKLFAGLSLFTFQSLRRARRAHRDRRCLERLRAASLGHRNAPWEPPQEVGSVKSLDVCLSHSPSGIWPNTHFDSIPQLAAQEKEAPSHRRDPDSETTSPSDSDTSSTVTCMNVLPPGTLTLPLVSGTWEPSTRTTRSHA